MCCTSQRAKENWESVYICTCGVVEYSASENVTSGDNDTSGPWKLFTTMTTFQVNISLNDAFLLHRSDSIQRADYIATPIQGFLGQTLKSKIMNQQRYYSANLQKTCNIIDPET